MPDVSTLLIIAGATGTERRHVITLNLCGKQHFALDKHLTEVQDPSYYIVYFGALCLRPHKIDLFYIPFEITRFSIQALFRNVIQARMITVNASPREVLTAFKKHSGGIF